MMRYVQIVTETADSYILDEVSVLKDVFAAWGHESLVNRDSLDERDVCIFHYTGEDIPGIVMQHDPARTAVFLHQYFEPGYEEHFARDSVEKINSRQKDLEHLVARAALSIGHSERAARVLESLEANRVRKSGHFLSDSAIETEDDFTTRMAQDGTINVVCYAPINPDCGLDHVIKSFFLLEKFENPEGKKFRLVLIGEHESSEGWMVKVQDALGEISLAKELYHVTGNIPWQRRNSFINNADIYINFDRYNCDGHGIIQALRQGIPVISCSDSVGAEILQDAPGVYSELIHSAIAESMAKLVEDNQWRQEYCNRQASLLEDLGNDKAAFTLKTLFSRFE
jgi:glycosyltransferase involved in cell wall biosynthesis